MTERGDARDDERRRRAMAQEHRGQVEEGSGRAIEGRSVPQMVSVRLEAELVGALRQLATSRGVSLSDVLRRGAELVVGEATRTPQVIYALEITTVKLEPTGFAGVWHQPTTTGLAEARRAAS